MPLETSTAAYRIVQEALTNAARHAGITLVTVRCMVYDNTLHLNIEDGGRGFDLTRLSPGTSSGLSSMRERALLLGGRLEVDSAPGKGTRIFAELPLPAPANRGKGEKRDKHSFSR
ncbi:MAG: hypothetical protein HYX96_03190 [Chloroflexi bacterium]|nr:hypothetical protein [Chloroflexota bacterium]